MQLVFSSLADIGEDHALLGRTVSLAERALTPAGGNCPLLNAQLAR